MVRSVRRVWIHAALRLVPHGQSPGNEIQRNSTPALTLATTLRGTLAQRSATPLNRFIGIGRVIGIILEASRLRHSLELLFEFRFRIGPGRSGAALSLDGIAHGLLLLPGTFCCDQAPHHPFIVNSSISSDSSAWGSDPADMTEISDTHSGAAVTSRKQAIAIGLWEARRAGKKVPSRR